MTAQFQQAIFEDLGRSPNASYITEIVPLILSVEHDLKHFRTYMKPINEETELLLAPGRTTIVYEPLGIVGIYGAWNYPILTVLKPLV